MGSTAARRQPKARKAAYHHGDLRPALVREALEMIGKGGVEQLTLREIARRIGVSHMAPYRHFPDKSALLAELADQGFKAMLAKMHESVARAPAGLPAALRLQKIGVGYVEFAVANPVHFRIMFGNELLEKPAFPELSKSAEATYDLLLKTVEECQAEGSIPPEVSTEEYALTAWSLVHGLSSLLISGQIEAKTSKRISAREIAERITSLLC
jgi:AcrR family transcriptional regulator